ncbi:MAG TPA: glycerol kinase [Propionibacteriaceae bacterium]|nr:glycerol kinase [Propionibacteriaceae bacterium]HBY24821.1 glycerol kinase [Propionibacteriaceae bacterium]
MSSAVSTSADRGAVLAVDQGTTNTKALLLDAESGTALFEGSAPTSIRYPRPGWVEQDADQIWGATLAAIGRCLGQSPGIPVLGIGVTNQRESVVCWNRKTGRPLGPVLGWQDARTSAWCDDLATSEPSARGLVRTRTGLELDPMFSAPKFRATLEAARSQGEDDSAIAIGTIDSWLIWKLTGEHATDVGNASRTLLLDLESADWHDDLLELFGIPRGLLPDLRPSDAWFGTVHPAFEGPLVAGTPVVAALADSHAAMYHHGCTRVGTGKATYGTGSSVMSPTLDARQAPEGVATTIAWHIDGQVTYAREGNIVASGAALDWMARTLGAPEGTAGGAFLTDLAMQASDSGGTSFVPAFSGLGAPYWDRGATGVICGVTAGTTRAHLARAALEGVAHQVADVVEAMESDGTARIEVLHADGGATASGLLMQNQADLLGRPVDVSDVPSASALGVGRLAARSLGYQPPAPVPGQRVLPSGNRRREARPSWHAAIARSRGLPVPVGAPEQEQSAPGQEHRPNERNT